MSNINYQFYKILDVIWRKRYVIILPTLLFPIMGYTIGSVTEKKYMAYTSMLIQETSKLNPFLEDFAVSAKLKERLSALQALLHSRHVLKQVAVDQDLITENSTKTEQERVINRLSSSIRMEMAGKDLIRIEYTDSNPTAIEPLLQTVSDHFIEQLLAPERSSMQDASTFLQTLLIERTAELEEAETALANFKNEYAQQLPELHLGNVNRLAQLKQKLFEKTAELAGAENSLGGIDQQLSKTNPVVAKLEEEIISQQSKLALLKSKYTDEHSQVKGAIRTLNRLQVERNAALQDSTNQIDVNQLWAIAANEESNSNKQTPQLLITQLDHLQQARSKVDALAEETKSLHHLINEQTGEASKLGALEKRLNELQRDLSVKRNLYEELLERQEMARITGALGAFEKEKRIKIIDLPFTPVIPITASPILFLIAGLVGGLFFGIGCAIIIELGDQSVRYKQDVLDNFDMDVLTRIPQVKPLGQGVFIE